MTANKLNSSSWASFFADLGTTLGVNISYLAKNPFSSFLSVNTVVFRRGKPWDGDEYCFEVFRVHDDVITFYNSCERFLT